MKGNVNQIIFRRFFSIALKKDEWASSEWTGDSAEVKTYELG